MTSSTYSQPLWYRYYYYRTCTPRQQILPTTPTAPFAAHGWYPLPLICFFCYQVAECPWVPTRAPQRSGVPFQRLSANTANERTQTVVR